MNRQELKYIIYSGIFAFVYFAVFLPLILKYGADKINPFLQFLIFNVGVLVFLQIFLKSVVLETKSRVRIGIGIALLFIGLDILAPPFAVSLQGDLLGNSGTNNLILVNSSSDYALGYLYTSLGVTGILVFLLTYVISPIVLFLISSLLIPNFVKEL